MNSSVPNEEEHPWRVLEGVPDLCAMPGAWAGFLGDRFAVFRDQFLRPNPALAGRRVAGAPLHFNWEAFGPALARALGCSPRASREWADHTRQVGAWTYEATPVFLTCNADPVKFEMAILRLCVGFDRPFIVFAPSNRFLNADNLACLSRRRAAFFELRSTVSLTPSGVLQPMVVPGELFTAFNPEQGEPQAEAARRAFALVERLDAGSPARPPSAVTVFRLYCVEGLSLGRISRQCRCSKATVFRRLRTIHRETGISPDRLRTFSPHLEKLCPAARVEKAREIHARGLIYDDVAAE